ncbi:kinase-like protein [Panus rudis PR-1116 ss-1]|nr:kinase-like protein [Panus rudis PR-1116 ss-1]
MLSTKRIFLPSPARGRELRHLQSVNRAEEKSVRRFCPGVLVKYGWDHEEEVRALQFIERRLSIPAPRVLHHAPFPDTIVEPWNWGREGVWYFFMDECPGVPLDEVIETLPPAELDHIAEQLIVILDKMRSITSTKLGSVSGGPYNNRFMPYPFTPRSPFSSVEEYLQYYRNMFLEFCGRQYVDELFDSFPTKSSIVFTHGDLLPRNIIVNGSTITGIIDWETAGFYPEFWEYSRMHFPELMTPGWDHILRRVFPEPRREQQIKAASQIVVDLSCKLPV